MRTESTYIPFIDDTTFQKLSVGSEQLRSMYLKNKQATMNSGQMEAIINNTKQVLAKSVKYIGNECHMFTQGFIQEGPYVFQAICTILNTAPSESIVFMHLGSGCYDNLSWGSHSNHLINSLIYTQAKTVALAAGPCSTVETAMYLFCKDKIMLPYSQLLFQADQYMRDKYKEFFYIYQVYLLAAKEQGIVSDEDHQRILEGKVMTIDFKGEKRFFN